MGKRIVIALGGNALGKNLPEQMIAVKHTAKAIVDLIEQGNEVIIAHGNGPQVGMIQEAMTQLNRSDPEKYIPCPLSVCVAMSQGYIGYDLQNALREEMLNRGIKKNAATVLTQVEVDKNDPAFKNPTKPIGSFMTEEEAKKLDEQARDMHLSKVNTVSIIHICYVCTIVKRWQNLCGYCHPHFQSYANLLLKKRKICCSVFINPYFPAMQKSSKPSFLARPENRPLTQPYPHLQPHRQVLQPHVLA